jgi:hypothetical protein
MPRRGVATAASKNQIRNFGRKNRQYGAKTPGGDLLAIGSNKVPVGSTGLECGKIDNDAPESTKNLELCLVS